ATVFPGADEVCDGVDNDCDGAVDTDDAGVVDFGVTGDDKAVEIVETCLRVAVHDERESRWTTLGIRDLDPAQPVTVDIDDEDARPDLPPVSLLGSLLAGIAVILAGSLAIEAVPRRRASGLLEQLRSTQTSTEELVSAWVIATAGLSWAAMAGFTVAFAAASGGDVGTAGPAVHSLVLAPLIAAASVRTSLSAVDVQAATIRWFLVVFALGLGTLTALGLIDTPALAALVPFGGSILASLGWLGPWGFLADGATIGWTVLLVGWCGRELASEEAASGGVDLALQRRARGNWWPEVLLLAACGLSCGVVAGGARFAGDVWLGATFGFVGLMLVPALVAPSVLGVPARDLMPFGRPRLRELVLTVPLVVGLFGLSTFVLGGTLALLPDNAIVRGFVEGMNELVGSPFGQVAIGLYPAVCEELLYRGVILGLLLRGGNRHVAVIGQAALFSLAHIVSIRLPWTFVFGLVLGYLRVRTGSLWPGMFAHFLFNVTAGLVAVYATSSPTEIPPEAYLYAAPMLLGLAALAGFRAARE
ncbi:MAG: CPBP family glutamic-type intramembrane protease, partial [Myxococcota bacterium]